VARNITAGLDYEIGTEGLDREQSQYLLSPQGQNSLKSFGFIPVTLRTDAQRRYFSFTNAAKASA
jgi:hypothetical protein